MTTTTPAEGQQVRNAFEQAARAHADKAGMDFTRLKTSGEYKYLRLEFMWRGWCLAQECAGKTTTAPVDEPDEQEDPLI